jgi:hypothetical protein
VFTLPWSAVSDRAIKAQVRVFGSPLLLLFEEGVAAHDEKIGAYRSRVIERLQAIRSDLEEHVDRLGGLALEIVNHVDDVRGPQLRTSVADLHDAVRELVDPFPGDRVPDPLWAMFTVGQPGVVLTSSGKVAQRLSEAYVSLQDRVTDESLRKRLQAEARLRSENDQSTSDLINQDEEMERRMATMEQHLRKLDEIAPTIERMMEKALASPDTDESTRREISEARKQLDKKLIELEKMLSDAAE